ncbi:protein-tyrosine phosphatase family protein [Rhizobium leguminosarum]|uniref:hypothetical protein n=1 Tax=Rhizobium leguminosarum TaxID=384 RepID=UPI003D0425C0
MSWFSKIYKRPDGDDLKAVGASSSIDTSGPEFADLYPTRDAVEKAIVIQNGSSPATSADNTSQIVENTGDLRGFSIDLTRFNQALENGDKRTVSLACKSGMRASEFIFNGSIHGREGPHGTYGDESMVAFLMENDCVNAAKLCPELLRMKPRPTFSRGQTLGSRSLIGWS